MDEELVWRAVREMADNLRSKAKDNVDLLGAIFLYREAALMAKRLSRKEDFGFRDVAGREAKEIAEVAFTLCNDLLKDEKRGLIFNEVFNELSKLKSHFKFRSLGI